MFGPDVSSLLLSAFLIAAPALAFCIKILFIIIHRVKEDKPVVSWYPILIVAVSLTILVSNPSKNVSNLVLESDLLLSQSMFVFAGCNLPSPHIQQGSRDCAKEHEASRM